MKNRSTTQPVLLDPPAPALRYFKPDALGLILATAEGVFFGFFETLIKTFYIILRLSVTPLCVPPTFPCRSPRLTLVKGLAYFRRVIFGWIPLRLGQSFPKLRSGVRC